MRPHGDKSSKGRGAKQKRVNEDEDEEETEKEFWNWLKNWVMKTESAVMQLSKMVGALLQDMEFLKKKERTQS